MQLLNNASRASAERKIGEVWQEVLGTGPLSLDDNMFNLGGTSIHIVLAYGKLRDSLGVAVTVLDLFSYPTIRSLAKHLFPAPEQPPPKNFQNEANRAARQWRASQVRRGTGGNSTKPKPEGESQ